MKRIKIFLSTVVMLLGGLITLPASAQVPTPNPNKVASDLKLIKLQLRERNDISKQFIVLRNFGRKTIDLAEYRVVIKESENKIKQLQLAAGKLRPKQSLVLVNRVDGLEAYLTEAMLLQCFTTKCDSNSFLPQIQAEVELWLGKQMVSSVKYGPKQTKNSVLITPLQDFISLTQDKKSKLGAWRAFSALKDGQVWLKADQLPPSVPTPPAKPSCQADEELLPNNKCAKKCLAGYKRDPQTLKCRKISQPKPPKVCDNGYILNPTTNRCVKIPAPPAPKTCPAGYVLNQASGRCNKLPAPPVPKSCPVGYFLNPATNRCNKLVLANTSLKSCPEGQYRHPETGRCRKVLLEADCKEGYELGPNNKCLKKCSPGYKRDQASGRCKKAETVCQDGFVKDAKTGVCVKASTNSNTAPTSSDQGDSAKAYRFDWLKLLNSPISGAVIASLVFVVYDKFFRKSA